MQVGVSHRLPLVDSTKEEEEEKCIILLRARRRREERRGDDSIDFLFRADVAHSSIGRSSAHEQNLCIYAAECSAPFLFLLFIHTTRRVIIIIIIRPARLLAARLVKRARRGSVNICNVIPRNVFGLDSTSRSVGRSVGRPGERRPLVNILLAPCFNCCCIVFLSFFSL